MLLLMMMCSYVILVNAAAFMVMMMLLQREFRWTNKTVRDVVLLVLVLPTLAYNAIVWQAHKDDEVWRPSQKVVVTAVFC